MVEKRDRNKPSKHYFALHEVERLAGEGYGIAEIAAHLGGTADDLREQVDKNRAMRNAIKVGEMKALSKVTKSVFNKALGGDTGAMKLYLRRFGWK